jgi:hypothetical protein
MKAVRGGRGVERIGYQEYLTLAYLPRAENWNRPKIEVEGINTAFGENYS